MTPAKKRNRGVTANKMFALLAFLLLAYVMIHKFKDDIPEEIFVPLRKAIMIAMLVVASIGLFLLAPVFAGAGILAGIIYFTAASTGLAALYLIYDWIDPSRKKIETIGNPVFKTDPGFPDTENRQAPTGAWGGAGSSW